MAVATPTEGTDLAEIQKTPPSPQNQEGRCVQVRSQPHLTPTTASPKQSLPNSTQPNQATFIPSFHGPPETEILPSFAKFRLFALAPNSWKSIWDHTLPSRVTKPISQSLNRHFPISIRSNSRSSIRQAQSHTETTQTNIQPLSKRPFAISLCQIPIFPAMS